MTQNSPEVQKALDIIAAANAAAANTLAAEQKAVGLEVNPNPSSPIDLASLIADARAKMQVPTDAKDAAVEATDPTLVNEMLAKASELADTIKKATAERELIKDFLKDVVKSAEVLHGEGSIHELTVHGATVFTYKPVVARVLNQTWIKANFPDIPENAEMWQDQISRPANFK